MLIIKIEALDNGAHENQTYNGKVIPNGYAVIPPEVGTMETLENFPFGNFEVEVIDGVPTMKKGSWSPLPKPAPVPETPTQLDLIESQVTYTAMMTDTLLEV